MSNTTAKAVDFSRRDRRAVASVATQFFVNGAVFASFIPRLPEIRDRVDISIGVLGALMTLAGAIGLVGSWAAPRVIDRYGTRRVLVVGASALLLTLPIMGFATVSAMFVFGFACMQAFDVIVDVAMNLQGSWLSARRHAPIVNRLHGLWSLGTVIGGIASAQLAGAGVSLQTHLTAVAAILAIALVFVGRGLLAVDEHVDATTPTDAKPPARRRTARGPLILLALAGAFAIAVEIVSSDWAAFRLSDDFGASAGFAGLGYVAYTSGMTVGRFAGDAVLTRLGATRQLQLATLLAAIGLFGASLATDRYVVLAAYAIAGLGISTFFPRLYDDAARLPGKRGAGLGALTAGSRITALAVPVVVGSLAATSLSVGEAIALVTLPSAAGFAIISLARGRMRR